MQVHVNVRLLGLTVFSYAFACFACMLQDTVHGILYRLIKLKEGPNMPAAGREAVLSWLVRRFRLHAWYAL